MSERVAAECLLTAKLMDRKFEVKRILAELPLDLMPGSIAELIARNSPNATACTTN